MAEGADLAPLSVEDAALWAAAEAVATDGMLPANRERIEILEPLGRAPDGGLRLRAPPGWADARQNIGIVRAALVHVGDAAGKHAAIVTG
jgi:hypothetical protein